MYAHVMRKWSLIKLLMLLFLPIMILLFYCQGGVNAMYLNTPRQQIQQQLHYNPYYTPQQNTHNFQGVEEKRYYSNENSNRFLSESNNNNNIYNNRKVDSHDSKNGDEMDDDSGEEEKKKNLLSIKSDKNLIRSDNNLSNNNNNINSNSYLHANNPHAIQNYLWIKRMQEKRDRHENFRHMSSRIATSSSRSLSSSSSSSSIINQTEYENLNSISSHISSQHISNNLNINSSNYRNRRDSSSLSNNNNNNSNNNNNNNNKKKRNNTNKFKKNRNKLHIKRHAKKRGNRRYCSANDPDALAFMAPTVFSGKVLSMTSERSSNFSVTFELQEVIKIQKNGTLPNKIRLQFNKTNKVECDINKEKLRNIANINQELEFRKTYYLFVNQITKTEFTILGQPIEDNKNVTFAIRKGVHKNYGQNATIEDLRYQLGHINSTREQQIDVNSKIRLVCKFKGRPTPKITWYFNKRPINVLPRSEVKIERRRSVLTIRHANISNAGDYECRAKNKISKNASRTIKIRVNQKRANSPNEEISGKTTCDMSSPYCYNGGTCMYFTQLSEYSCQCHEEYSGQRCEHKVPSNSTLPNNNYDDDRLMPMKQMETSIPNDYYAEDVV